MDLRKLKKLIDLVEESGIAEIEVTEGEEKVRITRTTAAAAPIYAAPAPAAALRLPPLLLLLRPQPLQPPPLPLAICPTRKNRLWSVRSTAPQARTPPLSSKSANKSKPAILCASSKP